MHWDCRYHPDATAGIRKIERGRAAKVTERIRELINADDPSDGAEPVKQRENRYRIEVEAHFVEFELNIVEKILKILDIE